MVDIARLVVRLEAENAKLTKSLAKSERDVKRFSKNSGASLKKFQSIAKAALGPVAVGIFVAATKQALDYADSIDKAAKVTGLTTDALQELRFAGDQVGLTTKDIDEGFRRFNRRLGEFVNSGGGPAAAALERLGFSLADIQGRDTGDIFRDVVAGLGNVESAAQRAALEAQLFGDDAGPKLDLLVRQGVGGINALAQEANDLGVILDKELIDNAVRAKDELAKVGQVVKAQVTAALIELSPVILAVSSAFLEAAKAANKFFGEANTPIEIAQENIDNLVRQATADKSKLDAIKRGDLDATVIDAIFGTKEGLEASIEEKRQAILGLQAFIEVERKKLETTTLAAPLKLPGVTVPEVKKVTPPKAEFVGPQLPASRKIDIEAGAKLTESLRTSDEKLFDSLEEYDRLLDQGVITQETWARAVSEGWEDVADQTEESTNEMSEFAIAAARSMQGALSSGFFDIMQGETDDLAANFKRTIDKMVADLLASQLLDLAAGAFGGAGGGIGAFFSAAARASGGPVSANRPFLVGESGPELFIPERSGHIVPNHALSGSVTVIQNVMTPDVNSFRHSSRQLAQDQSRLLGQARAMS